MREAADDLNFELAKELRDRLFEVREMAAHSGAGKSVQEGR
jgi:excinuclease UvrABC helicase subunit UvrB